MLNIHLYKIYTQDSAIYLHLLHNVTTYEDDECELSLSGANMQPLDIVAKGYFQSLPQPIYVIRNLEENLFSTTNADLSFMQFTSSQKVFIDNARAGGLVTDVYGKIQFVVNSKLKIDLFNYQNEKYNENMFNNFDDR